MDYRIVTDMQELGVLCDLEHEIWQAEEREMAPIVVKVTTMRGGLALGAYDEDRMVGMLWSFPALRVGEWVLWSFVTGVLPEYRSQNVGFGLKQTQRVWAIEKGYKHICWTFDPMRAQNANFNLRKLGAYVDTYVPNLYGEMRDALNPGLPTDRFEAVWDVTAPRVLALAQGYTPAPFMDYDPLPVLLSFDGERLLAERTIPDGLEAFRLEIPLDYHAVMIENVPLGQYWQSELRRLSTMAFAAGYRVVDLLRHGQRCEYILQKAKL